MKVYFLTEEQVKGLEKTLQYVDKAIKELEKELDAGTADSFDSTDYDKLIGTQETLVRILKMIGLNKIRQG